MEGATSRRRRSLQSRSPSLDLDSLYGAGPADPGSAKFYEADGLHLKMGDRRPAAAARRLRPAAEGAGAADAKRGDHPRPAQRREPRRRADPLRVHPVPQPRRRHAPGVGAAGAAVRRGAQDRHQALPVDDPAPTTCRGSARPAVVDDVFTQRPEGVRGRRAADRACRRCRSSSRSPRSGSGTAWCGRRTAGTRSSRSGRSR